MEEEIIHQDFQSIFVDNIIIDDNKIGHKNDTDLIELLENQIKINGNLIVTGTFNQSTTGGDGNLDKLEVDNIIIDNNKIGHVDDNDLDLICTR